MVLRCRQFEYEWPRPAMIMGILNVTPDSFSDGGKFMDASAAVDRALQMVEQGAEMIDVGGESTRPGANPVEEKEELRRVMPVIEELAGRVKVPISIDTMKPGVARAALQAGASIVNDVAAANREKGDEMWRAVAETNAGYVVMHMQGTPATMQTCPKYDDVVAEVGAFFIECLERLSHCGVTEEQTILDPGIGFGKAREHNLQLLGGTGAFVRMERPLLLGVSRKSFLGGELAERLPAALACACVGVKRGAQIIRAHDVAETARAVRMAEQI